MEYDLDYEIRFNTESEFKNLYSWSLQEFSSDGKKIGQDQIPWNWSLIFSASELRYSRSIGTDKYNEDPKSIQDNEVITAILYSGRCTDGKWLDRDVSYSMFGTDRKTNDFTLCISKAKDGENNEKCELWGCVSYTTEIDFTTETTDDTVQISISLSPQKFDSLKQAINDNNIDLLSLRLGGVDGFYSECSPSISTRNIKILANGEEQKVIIPDGCKISHPRLGDVKEFDLSITRRNRLNIKNDFDPIDVHKIFDEYQNDETKSDGMDENSLSLNQQNIINNILSQMRKNERALAKLRFPLWLIVILLAVLVSR